MYQMIQEQGLIKMNLNKVKRSSLYFLLLKMQIIQSKKLTLVCQPDLEKKLKAEKEYMRYFYYYP